MLWYLYLEYWCVVLCSRYLRRIIAVFWVFAVRQVHTYSTGRRPEVRRGMKYAYLGNCVHSEYGPCTFYLLQPILKLSWRISIFSCAFSISSCKVGKYNLTTAWSHNLCSNIFLYSLEPLLSILFFSFTKCKNNSRNLIIFHLQNILS